MWFSRFSVPPVSRRIDCDRSLGRRRRLSVSLPFCWIRRPLSSTPLDQGWRVYVPRKTLETNYDLPWPHKRALWILTKINCHVYPETHDRRVAVVAVLAATLKTKRNVKRNTKKFGPRRGGLSSRIGRPPSLFARDFDSTWWVSEMCGTNRLHGSRRCPSVTVKKPVF